MKKPLVIFTLILCLLAALCVPAQADYYAQVYNTDTLNIRSGPGTDYPWLGSIPRDGQVRVIAETDGWYQVLTLDGSVTGYMSKSYLTPVSQPASEPAFDYYNDYASKAGFFIPYAQGRYGTVTGTDSLNIRSGPGTEYGWVGSVGRGERIILSGEQNGWYYGTVASSVLTGYMSKTFIEEGNGNQAGYGSTAYVSNPVGTRFLNLREYPSYDSAVLDIFYTGETCTVISRQSDGWVYVSAVKNGARLYGYFRGEYLSASPVTPDPGTVTDSAIVNTWQNGGNGGSLNLRSEPGMYGSILLRIPNGSAVRVYQKGRVWWQVAYNGVTGYVDSGFLGRSGGGSQPSTGGNATVRMENGGKLNLREQPNAASRVLGQYENGSAVTVIQRGDTWCYVQAGGQSGYMMTRYLSIRSSSATKTVVNSNGGTYVNLRTTPDKNSNNVNVRVPNGATVTVLSWGAEWSQVRYGNTTGYMMSWFLK